MFLICCLKAQYGNYETLDAYKWGNNMTKNGLMNLRKGTKGDDISKNECDYYKDAVMVYDKSVWSFCIDRKIKTINI